MSDSILLTIKKMLGLTEEYTAFDPDIIVLINSAFMTLEQLGVGSQKHFLKYMTPLKLGMTILRTPLLTMKVLKNTYF